MFPSLVAASMVPFTAAGNGYGSVRLSQGLGHPVVKIGCYSHSGFSQLVDIS